MSLSKLLQVLISTENVPKHDLRKKQEFNLQKELNDLFQRNFYIICTLAIIFLLIVFVFCCYWLVGVSAVDSGTVYNGWERII